MCGLAGIVDWGGRDRRALEAALGRMDAEVATRGPDAHGTRVVEGRGGAVAYLAHRRLAILDRSAAGHQPMGSSDGRAWLTFNGEIYNFRELQARVRDAGVTLRSTSDSEVLLEHFQLDDLDVLPRLRGMFAFAVWQADQGRLTLARDRFGIKPLVWASPEPGLVVFASTPQALAASGWVTLRPAPGMRAAFLAHGSVPAGRSFWDGVHVVPSGASLTFEAGRVQTRRYWDTRAIWQAPRPDRPVAEVAPLVRAAIEDSVASHLVSDVPVAVFLSGGLDSTAIAAAAARASSAPLRTLTVTMPDRRFDESVEAGAIAKRLGTDHTAVPLPDLDLDATLDAFIGAMAQPTVDGLNTFLVARAARSAGLRVALTGVGGDELFGGYPSFHEVPRLHALLQRWGPGLRAGAPLLRGLRSSRAVKLASMAASRAASLEAVWWGYRGVWPLVDAEHLAGESVPALEDGPIATPVPFEAVRALEWRHFLERQLLPDADAFTMCDALELRTPLVDHRLVEVVAAAGRWPRGGAPTWKSALFAAWPDWTGPRAGRAGKQGFVLPMDHWLRQTLTTPRPVYWRDVADRLQQPAYREAVRAFLAGRSHWTRPWALYVLDRITERHG